MDVTVTREEDVEVGRARPRADVGMEPARDNAAPELSALEYPELMSSDDFMWLLLSKRR